MSWLVLGRSSSDPEPALHNFSWAFEAEKILSGKDISSDELRYAAHCSFQAAFQAGDSAQFDKMMAKAFSLFERAADLCKNDDIASKRFHALALYCRAQTAKSETEIHSLLNQALSKISDALNQQTSYDNLYSPLAEFLLLSNDMIDYEPNFDSRLSAIKNALQRIDSLPENPHDDITFVLMSEAMRLLSHAFENHPDLNTRRKCAEQEDRLRKSLSTSIGVAKDPRAIESVFSFTGFPPSTFEQLIPFCPFEELLPKVEVTSDKVAIGSSLAAHLRIALDEMETLIDLESAKKMLETRKRESERGISELGAFGGVRREYTCPGYVYWTLADYYGIYQSRFSPDLEERKKLLDLILEISGKINLNSPPVAAGMQYSNLSLYGLTRARLEQDHDQRAELLEKAWNYGQSYEKSTRTFLPYFPLIDAIHFRPYGNMKRELAHLKPSEKIEELRASIEMFAKAIQNLESALATLEKIDRPQWETYLAAAEYELGGVELELWKEEPSGELLQPALRSLNRAIEILSPKIDPKDVQRSLVLAQTNWRKAECLDSLGEYGKAAESFHAASSIYRILSESYPGLKQDYENYSNFMSAWGLVEEGKSLHKLGEFAKASGCYFKASKSLETTNHWAEMGRSFAVWGTIEEAEEKSLQWKASEAKELFEKAQAELSKITTVVAAKSAISEDERTLSQLSRIVSLRRQYCEVRATLEDGRQSESRGDLVGAARAYLDASEKSSMLAEKLDVEAEKEDLSAMAGLCKAWSLMVEAERKSKPDIYSGASEIFAKIRDESSNQRISTQAAANSLLCQAFRYASEFVLSREQTEFSKAKPYLEQAAQVYASAGLEVEASWAKASSRMLDAYSYITLAEKEAEPEKKTKYFLMAEKLIESVEELYAKAGLVGKKNQVHKVMENVREEKEISLGLMEILVDPVVTVSTSGFSTPAEAYEVPSSAESLDQANVQVHLFVSSEKINIEEHFDIEVEMTNLGRGPAMLVRLDDVQSSHLEISSKPEHYRLVKGALDLKGMRLAPSKSEEARITLRPRTKGSATIRPKLVYLDERGKFKTSEPEAQTIEVIETGLGGWLRRQ